MNDQRQDADVKPRNRPTLDEIGEASFPASDPPQSWTWEVGAAPASPLGAAEEEPAPKRFLARQHTEAVAPS